MSNDVRIIPTVELSICWGELKNMILQFSAGNKGLPLFDLALVSSKTAKEIDDLECIDLSFGYFFRSKAIVTLSLSVIEKDDVDDDRDFVEDCGFNLSRKQQEELSHDWRKAPYTILVSSGANRSSAEVEVMPYICAGIAKAHHGKVAILERDSFDVGKGIFSPEEFSKAICIA